MSRRRRWLRRTRATALGGLGHRRAQFDRRNRGSQDERAVVVVTSGSRTGRRRQDWETSVLATWWLSGIDFSPVRAGDSCCHGARCLLPRGNNISAPPFRVYLSRMHCGFSPGRHVHGSVSWYRRYEGASMGTTNRRSEEGEERNCQFLDESSGR